MDKANHYYPCLFERRYVRIILEIFEILLLLREVLFIRLSSFRGIFGYHQEIVNIRGWTDLEESSPRYYRRPNCKDFRIAFGLFLFHRFILFYDYCTRDQAGHADHQVSGGCISSNITFLDRYLARQSQLQNLPFYGNSHVSRVYVDVDVRSI